MTQPKTKFEFVDVDEERRETGTAYAVVGWLCWMFAFLVMFFHPAAIKLGRLSLLEIALFLAVAGLALNIIGFRTRGRKS